MEYKLPNQKWRYAEVHLSLNEVWEFGEDNRKNAGELNNNGNS